MTQCPTEKFFNFEEDAATRFEMLKNPPLNSNHQHCETRSEHFHYRLPVDRSGVVFHDYKEYLEQSLDRKIPIGCNTPKSPNCHWSRWADILIEPLLAMTPNAANPSSVDDHQSSTIGNGFTLGTVAGFLSIEEDSLEMFPPSIRLGLFAKAGVFPVCIRFSEAPVDQSVDKKGVSVAAFNLARLAAKIELAPGKEIDLLTTESLPNFPIGNNSQLATFHEMTLLKAKKSFQRSNIFVHAFRTVAHVVSDLRQTLQMAQVATPSHEDIRKKHLPYNVGGKEFYSMTPFAVQGPDAAAVFKFRFKPLPSEKNRYRNKTLAELLKDATDDDLARLSKNKNTAETMAMNFREDLRQYDIRYYLQVQFSTSPECEPLNDVKITWRSKWYTLGLLVIPKQNVNAEGLSDKVPIENSKRLSFCPGKIHQGVGDISAYRQFLYPLYDQVRQEVLLGVKGGIPQQCPFHDIMQNMCQQE